MSSQLQCNRQNRNMRSMYVIPKFSYILKIAMKSSRVRDVRCDGVDPY